ncbi:MAG: efflux RND transporter periplasmic adaptor subunit [Actinomycetota bacterium]|nr:efflux RND transporter periplasmic adaptor subunit [Actinomycetota bacterium]
MSDPGLAPANKATAVVHRPWSRRAVLAAVAAALVIVVALFVFWPSDKAEVAVTEKPPTLEGHDAEGGEHGDEHSQEGAIELDDETAELMGVETEQAVETEIDATIATTGRVLVAPNAHAVVGAKVAGRVVSVSVEPGREVRAGQTLVVVDSPEVAELRGELAEARARLSIADAAVARVGKAESRAAAIQAKSRLDLAEANLTRKRRLAEIGAVAGREVQEAEAELTNAKAEYEFQTRIQVTREQQEARGEAEGARATVARLSSQLSALGASPAATGGQVAISSPVSGTVIDVHASVGEAVTPDKEILTVMNLSNVIVEAQLPESQAARVGPGRRLVARVPGVPEGVFEGTVESVGRMVDPAKRTVPVRARVDNTRALLRHEMGVEVQIAAGSSKRAVTVPTTALVDEEGLKVVYVKEGERYERRVVTVGSVSYNRAEILSGVEAGEEVVAAGAYQLANARKGGGEGGGHDDDH